MNETNLLIDHAFEDAQADAARLDRVAFGIACFYTKAEAAAALNDHFAEEGETSEILQYLAAFATGGKQEREDAIVYLKCAVNDVMTKSAHERAQRAIDTGMDNFDEPDGDA